MYFSTAHWRPLLNGYSGFAPPSYFEMLHALQDFPAASALDYLRGRGVRYLLVHERFYLRGGFEDDVAALSGRAGLIEKAGFESRDTGRSYVYELVK